MMRRSLLALAVLAAVLGTPIATPDAGAWTNGVCTSSDGVTVVIDFQDLGGGVHVRCAPQPVTSGFSALQQAGIDHTTTVRFPGFICKIAGKPESDPCQTASPATAYWSYWLAGRGGQWCYSNWGAGNRTPPPGSVEGWSFSLGQTASTSPAPRFAVPAPLPGTNPGSLSGNDCDPSATAPRPGGSTPAPTVAPRPPAAPAPVATTPPSGAAPGAGPTPAAGAGVPIHEQHSDAPTAGTPGATTGATASGADTQTDAQTDAQTGDQTGDGPDAEVDGATAAAGGATDSTGNETTGGESTGDRTTEDEATDGVALADDETAAVDLSGDDRDSGTPIGVIIAAVLVAALGGGSFLIRRRRGAADPA